MLNTDIIYCLLLKIVEVFMLRSSLVAFYDDIYDILIWGQIIITIGQ